MRWQIHWWDPSRRRISSNWVERTPSARLAEYVISSPRALQPLLPWRTVDIFVSNKILNNMLNTYSNSGRRHRSAYNGKLFVHSRNPPSSNWNHRCRVSKRKENCTFLRTSVFLFFSLISGHSIYGMFLLYTFFRMRGSWNAPSSPSMWAASCAWAWMASSRTISPRTGVGAF